MYSTTFALPRLVAGYNLPVHVTPHGWVDCGCGRLLVTFTRLLPLRLVWLLYDRHAVPDLGRYPRLRPLRCSGCRILLHTRTIRFPLRTGLRRIYYPTFPVVAVTRLQFGLIYALWPVCYITVVFDICCHLRLIPGSSHTVAGSSLPVYVALPHVWLRIYPGYNTLLRWTPVVVVGEPPLHIYRFTFVTVRWLIWITGYRVVRVYVTAPQVDSITTFPIYTHISPLLRLRLFTFGCGYRLVDSVYVGRGCGRLPARYAFGFYGYLRLRLHLLYAICYVCLFPVYVPRWFVPFTPHTFGTGGCRFRLHSRAVDTPIPRIPVTLVTVRLRLLLVTAAFDYVWVGYGHPLVHGYRLLVTLLAVGRYGCWLLILFVAFVAWLILHGCPTFPVRLWHMPLTTLARLRLVALPVCGRTHHSGCYIRIQFGYCCYRCCYGCVARYRYVDSRWYPLCLLVDCGAR